MSVKCTTGLNNLSKTQCEASYGQILALWLDTIDDGITLANALAETNWASKIYATAAERMFVLNPGANAEITREQAEAVFKEYNTGSRKKIRNGYLDLTFAYDGLTFCQAEKLKDLNGLRLYAYALTSGGYIVAGGDAITLKPVPVELFVGEPIPPENNDSDWTVNIYVRYTNTHGNFKNAVNPVDDGDFTPLNVDGIINIEFGSINADITDSEVITTITTECDGAEVDDLTTASDVIVRVKGGAALTVDALTHVNNVYTFTINAGTPLTAVPHEILTKKANNATQKKYEYAVATEFTPVP